jgi:hypothetical protein
VIDGDGADWLPYAAVATDPQGDTTGGAHTDMKAVFTEQGQNYVYVMVERYDPPLLLDGTVELNLALVGSDDSVQELHTNIRSDGSFRAWVDVDRDGNWEDYPVSGALTAWRNVMELRLPLRELGDPLVVETTFVNLWCEVDGEWTWVDMIVP